MSLVTALVMLVTFVPNDPAAAGTGKARLAELERERSVPGRDFTAERPPVENDAAEEWTPSADKLPVGDFTVQVAPGNGAADSPAARDSLRAAPGNTLGSNAPALGEPPVRLRQVSPRQAAGSRTTAAVTEAPAPVGMAAEIEIKDRTTARKAGVEGLLFTAAPVKTATASAASGAVEVELDYTAIKDAYGGDWGSRLRLVRLPACALTTPEKAECRTRTELGGANDAAERTVSATVDLPQAKTARTAAPMVLAASAAASGPGGSHEATSLSPTGSWMAGSSSGGFSWSYPVEAPEVPGGPQPEIELSYSSQSVDGRTASTNSQSSWIAEGWDYEPGFIERRFRSCADDKGKVDGKVPNNSGETADLCWGSDHVVMSLGGSSTELVKNDASENGKEEWRPADDDGSRLERKTGADNGAKDGEYWILTGTDGVRYHFGLNKLPGATTQRTNSALTVPVFGNHPDEPCHASTFAASDCAQAYRWNLDYVTDPLGDAMTLWWNKEENHYGQHMKADQQISYTRAAHLSRIDYGQRASDLFGRLPAGRVDFTTAERCIPSSGFDCAVSKRTAANAKYWPDTPLDQECASGAKCTDKYSPTFWSTKRLVRISTKVLSGSALTDVDSWELEQKFPPTGDGSSPALWLESITRTGHGAGSTAAMPKVTFAGTQMDNRVDGIEGLPPYSRLRIHAIDTETGGRIGVTYSPRECKALEPRKMPASPETNTLRCYPQYWMPKGALKPVEDWFHKYVVTEVREDDLVTDAPDKVTSYEYLGSPAWAYDDGEFTENKQRTWSQYRGYERVRTRLGSGTDVKQLTEDRYFRGMHGDKLPTGTRTAAVEDSRGGSAPDLGHLQGQPREHIEYASDGGPVDSSVLTTAWAVRTASRARPGTTALEAWMARPRTVSTRERVKGETWRTSTETTEYDAYGLPTEVDETTAGGKRRCTVTSYARNTGLHLLEPVSRELTTLGACGTTGGKVVEDSRTLYDNLPFGGAPVKGLPTEVQELNAKGDGYTTVDRTAYDIHGRETETWDAENRRTSVVHTPLTHARPVKTVTTDPLGHTETTEFDAVRGLPVKETDANDRSATMQYDPLGRLLKVWEIDRDPATKTPSATYDYTIRRDGPTVVTNRTLKDNGEYAVSYEIMDGLLRERQTQDEAVDGPGRIVNDTFYDSVGREWKSNDGYFHSAEPEPRLLEVGDNEVPSQNRTTFDGMGDPVAEITYHRGNEKFRTSTERDGDVSTAVPPKGDTVTATFTDAEGRTERIREYTDTARTTWRDTVYEYDDFDNVVKITAPGGAATRFEYDGRGRQVSLTDPDGGTTRLTYDDSDNVTSTTDPRGNTLVTTLDEGGRPTSLREGSDKGPKRIEWTYDTLLKGLPTSAIRYENGREYREEVTAYDSAYRVKATRTVIPAEETGLGGAYEYKYGYTPTGNLAFVQPPGVGGLVSETIVFRYNSDGLPISIGGTASYLNDVKYSAFGEVLRTDAGVAGRKVHGTYLYDEFTRRLTDASFDRSVSPGHIGATRYTYDDAGNVTRIKDTPGAAAPDSGKTDTQCFVYNQLRQMTSAWTAKDECQAPASKDTVGGPDPYWQTYAFDEAGNRKQLVEKDPAGDTAKDVTRTYTYGKPGVGGPNALAEIKSAGPGGERLSTLGYDNAGNTTTRQLNGATQTLEWNVEGDLASVSQPVEGGGVKKTSYLYGADGSRLIRAAADGSKTLYLGEAELTVSPDGTSKTAERFYAHPDGAMTVRATGGGRQLVLSDHHGSSTTTVDLVAAGMGVTRRKLMPFGEERGPQPSAWPGALGFVGGTVDADTGLTRLGARDYDPATGRFLSVDPMVDYGEPATINPYAYSNNAPATFSDPSGLFWPIVIVIGLRAGQIAVRKAAQRRLAREALQRKLREQARKKAAAKKRAQEEAKKRAKAKAAREAARRVIAAQRAAAKKAAQKRAAAKRASERRAAAQAKIRSQRAAARREAAKRATARKAAARPKPSPRPRSQPRPRPKPSQAKKPSQTKSPTRQTDRCESNSFTATTLVVMADGSKKPISKVKTGEKVVATDPKTGRTTVQTVAATIIGKGAKKLVKVGLAEHGQANASTSLTATDGHPFWVPSVRAWLPAAELKSGTWLRTRSKTWAQVDSVRRWNERTTVYNLTVTDTHTYYVLAGATPVLVHNTGGNGHMCDISVTSPDGKTKNISLESGDMTPEEASLGYPNNAAFTHTEHRLSRMAGASTGPNVSLPNDPFAGKFPLSAGDAVRMQGQLPPCSRCKGAMNRMVRELGVSVTYGWSGAKGSGSWTAGRRRR
ncbi:RHS repeat-associated core domain-containing protein [Streptomyces californicus]|uniref:RHS repeat-associated core domain-containing protein n=1 Tax=Streptomyces californicus TaxID=67351 RepID=UPI001E57DC5A|nr:RHS repeat-associated core domain-containing protein [Streptomyces californicus]MCC0576895.1 Rhs family-like protein [Streptomyces californicus]